MPELIRPIYNDAENISEKISNVSQIGGIETSVMDSGYSRGTRIAWINTGSGLRYKVVLDRCMDIAETFFNQYGLSWISSTGVRAPQPFSDSGISWLRTFGGGLVTTCGLSHVGGPEKDEFGDRGLHGLISNSPADIVSLIQPDPKNGKFDMSITGIIKEATIFGPDLELRRTISSRLGEPWLHIHDEITNNGNTPAPHMLLYHFNFGWPLVDEGAELIYNGAMNYVNEERDKHIFNKEKDFKNCPGPLPEHRGAGEAASYFDISADNQGNCTCGIINEKIASGISLSFKKEQLPWLTNWQHWAPGEYVTGLEPCTHPPIGQAAARKNGTLIFIAPKQKKEYELKFEVLQGADAFAQLRKHNY